jgi:predicted membrane-bound spermidine synthase
VRVTASASIRSPAVLYLAFFISGFAAVVYQLIWQRVLLGLYGASIESVTVVVAAFLSGLGVGGLLGGQIADRRTLPLWGLFVALECAIGAFGWMSVDLFRSVGAATVTAAAWQAWLAVGCLLWIPTALMGATLPILIAHLTTVRTGAGRAAGWLYGANTLGSAAGAIVSVTFVVGPLGQQGTARFAAVLNVVAAALVLWRRPA